MRFEIFLGSQRLVLVGESAIPDQFPRLEFGGVRGFAGVVLAQAGVVSNPWWHQCILVQGN
jgi:hypothetical protein